MRHIRYDESRAEKLLPLLESIATEIRERTEHLERIEAELEARSEEALPDQSEIRDLVAQAATHRRGLRLAKQELERLGCSVVGMEPITFRIPGRVGRARRSFVWQTGEFMK